MLGYYLGGYEMKFEMNRLHEMEYDDDLEWVRETITSHTRWNVGYETVFKVLSTGKFYLWCENRDATEMQDTWVYETHVECDEVHPVEKVVVVYE